MPDEILEGDVGRSFQFEGKDFWFKEPDPIQELLDFKETLFEKDPYRLRSYFFYTHIDPTFSFRITST